MDDPQAVELDRIRRSAFNITSSFEGSKSYANYQNYDAGIISYGRFQFTLGQGALVKVVNYYLAASSSDTASQLRAYQARIQARDATLRDDQTLKALLIAAAAETAMQAAQDRVVMESYWVPARDSMTSRGIVTPLGSSLIFDMAIEHGPSNKLTQTAESQLGAPPKSMLGQNGLTETQLIKQVAQVRHDYLYNFADQNGLPGVKTRADFWVALVGQDDWQLQGDANGNVFVYGNPVQVRNPPGASLVDPANTPGVTTTPTTPPSPTAPVALAAAPPTSMPTSPSSPGADFGQAANGSYTTNQTLAVYDTPSTNGVLMGRVEAGRQLTVTRQYTPSTDEEWLLTDVGWVAYRLPGMPGQVFGDIALS